MSAITTRAGKGSALTNAEVDANFTNLNTDKAEKSITISAGTGLTGGGDLSVNRTLGLATSGVSAGTFGGNNSIPTLTIDAYGRVTAAGTVTPSGTWGISISGNAATATTADALNGANSYGGFNFYASGAFVVGSGGAYQAGSIYSDTNWGMIFRAKQDAPAMAQFMWANAAGTELFRYNGSALTTNITGNAATVSSITSGQVTTALGYTPARNSGWQVNIGSLNDLSTDRAGIVNLDGYAGGITGAPITSYNGSLLHIGNANRGFQLYSDYSNGGLWFRRGADGWQGWQTILNSTNYNSFAPTLTGNGASGTWGIAITGNAGNTSSISNAVGNSYSWNGIQYFVSNLGGYVGSTDSARLQAWSSGANAAFMSFHRSGNYAVNFGLDADNVLRMGGWSAAANRWELDMSGNNWVASSFRAPIFYDSNDTGRYVDPNSTSSFVGLTVSNTISGSINGNAEGYSRYFPTAYVGGQQLNPQTYFSQSTGLKVAMTAVAGYWSDTLWINGYAGGDVLSMCALHTSRQATPRMWISTQASNATAYGTIYEFPTLGYNSGNGNGLYAGIYYDSNNTGYFCNPDGRSRLSSIDYGDGGYYLAGGSWGFRHNTPSGYIEFGPANTGTAHIYSDRPSFYFNQPVISRGYRLLNEDEWINSKYFGSDGNMYANASMRAPIFYDQNDTGYYDDPNTTGISYRGRGQIFLGPNSSGVYFRIGGNGGATDHATIAASNGNLHLDAQSGYSLYLAWYNTSAIQIGGTMYIPFIYDRDNAAYYCNPAGNSNFYTIGAQSFDITSDDRLKTRLGAIENPLEKVAMLDGFMYVPNEAGVVHGMKNEPRPGLSAQQIQRVLDGVVSDDGAYLSVNYPGVIPLLVEAIKALTVEVELLKKVH